MKMWCVCNLHNNVAGSYWPAAAPPAMAAIAALAAASLAFLSAIAWARKIQVDPPSATTFLNLKWYKSEISPNIHCWCTHWSLFWLQGWKSPSSFPSEKMEWAYFCICLSILRVVLKSITSRFRGLDALEVGPYPSGWGWCLNQVDAYNFSLKCEIRQIAGR